MPRIGQRHRVLYWNRGRYRVRRAATRGERSVLVRQRAREIFRAVQFNQFVQPAYGIFTTTQTGAEAMAAQGRRTGPSLESELFTEGYRFSFFEAVRLLARIYPDRALPGGLSHP